MKRNLFSIEYETLASFDDFIADAKNSENLKIINEAINNYVNIYNAMQKNGNVASEEDTETANYINFLLLKGDTATGKTHLLDAIAYRIHELNPDIKIILGQANRLVSTFSDTKNQAKKIKSLEDVDVLLLDDLHLLADKIDLLEPHANTESQLASSAVSQNELAKYLDLLLKSKAFVVLTYSPDNDFSGFARMNSSTRLDEALYSRLFHGVTLNLLPASLNTLANYAQKESNKAKLSFTKPMCLTLARFARDIRQLHGLIKTITSYVKVNNLSFAEDELTNFLKNFEGKKEITPDVIILQTAQYYQLQPKDIKGKSRLSKNVLARQMSMFLCRQLLGLSYPKIAQVYGGKDHTTVIYACSKIEKDTYLFEMAKDLSQKILQEASSRQVGI